MKNSLNIYLEKKTFKKLFSILYYNMNSTNNSFEIAAKKVFSDLYALIKEDENKIDDKNVTPNEIDDKPKPVNLLYLSTDILNIIGDFVKKDNNKREREDIENSEQIINGKIIIFRNFCGNFITRPLNTKEDIKDYIFDYIDREFPDIKTYASNHKIRLNKDDKRRCAWVLFKRCKLIFETNELYHNKVIYNMDDEEKDIFEEYLKLKKLNSPQKFEY